MAIIKFCPGCERKDRYAKSEKSKLCGKCVQEGKKALTIELKKDNKS